MFVELQFANFSCWQSLSLSLSLFILAMPRRKVGTQGPVDLVGPDRSEEHDSSAASLHPNLFYELEEITNIFSKWLLSPGKIFLSFRLKIFFFSDYFPIWEDISEH